VAVHDVQDDGELGTRLEDRARADCPALAAPEADEMARLLDWGDGKLVCHSHAVADDALSFDQAPAVVCDWTVRALEEGDALGLWRRRPIGRGGLGLSGGLPLVVLIDVQ
jgi:hypothetical protein